MLREVGNDILKRTGSFCAGYAAATALKATHILAPNPITSSICTLACDIILQIASQLFQKAPHEDQIMGVVFIASLPISYYTANFIARFGYIESIGFLETLAVEITALAIGLGSLFLINEIRQARENRNAPKEKPAS